MFKLANHLRRVHGMTKATAGVLSDETLRPHRIASTTSRRRLRLCVQCNKQYRRLDVHLLETHMMPIDNVGVLLADERKKRANETTRTRRTEHHDAPPVTTSGCAILAATKGLRIHNTVVVSFHLCNLSFHLRSL